MIVLTDVSKKFRSKSVVKKISFKAKEGEIIGFLGPNGAGKTTTMRIILGYLRPTEGSVSVFDSDPIKDRIAILKKVGYLPENNPLYPDMKVSEYLRFISDIKGVKKYERVVKDVSIEDVLTTKIEELSRGYKQRVGLAAALLSDPDLLILDEPTSGLDPIEQDKIRKLIKKLAKKKTIIFSTHILSEVEDIATRLTIISKGNLVFDGKKPKARGGVDKLFKRLTK